jgi:hypothetical protein
MATDGGVMPCAQMPSPQHVWVLAVVGEGRGRLDIASTCSLCGALNDDSGPTPP